MQNNLIVSGAGSLGKQISRRGAGNAGNKFVISAPEKAWES